MQFNRSSSSSSGISLYNKHSNVVPFIRSEDRSIKHRSSRVQGFKIRLLGCLQILGDLFLHSSEPKIQQKRDRSGNLYFKVYDPMTQHSCTLDSEREVRVWLEKRYYR